MDQRLERLNLLFAPDGIDKLTNAKVAVIGLGGVGGPALECLVRSGIVKFLLIDSDIVQPSNLNRQTLYDSTDIGSKKVAAAKKRIQAINPRLEIATSDVPIEMESISILDDYQPDYVIDAIDNITGKCALIKWSIQHHVPFVSSLGMGNRIKAELIGITTLMHTEYDPLAKALRTALRKQSIDIAQVPVVFSSEIPIRKQTPVGSYMAVTASAGLLLAHYIVATILERQDLL
ncbi:MAG TPA: ThiF family adenylyltransferase [Bacilli bacterium]|nr:ThiF family adenylyltransferase [Bacilli bacterium]